MKWDEKMKQKEKANLPFFFWNLPSWNLKKKTEVSNEMGMKKMKNIIK